MQKRESAFSMKNVIKRDNPFSTGIIEKLDFWDDSNYTNFKHQ